MQYNRSTWPLSSTFGSSSDLSRPFGPNRHILTIPSSQPTAKVSSSNGSHWKSDTFDLFTRLNMLESGKRPNLFSSTMPIWPEEPESRNAPRLNKRLQFRKFLNRYRAQPFIIIFRRLFNFTPPLYWYELKWESDQSRKYYLNFQSI